MTQTLDEKKTAASSWFRELRDTICANFEAIEAEYAALEDSKKGMGPMLYQYGSAEEQDRSPSREQPINFTRTPWARDDGGAGEISIMKGRVFEKVGVNISTVHGEFSEQFRDEIPGATQNPIFWAAGISLVAHMSSPLIPAAHFNTRMIIVGEQSSRGGEPPKPPRSPDGSGSPSGLRTDPTNHDIGANRIWFGGGGDLNPMFPMEDDTAYFHNAFKIVCDELDRVSRASEPSARASDELASQPARGLHQQINPSQQDVSKSFYEAFRKWCDEYFFIPHRGEARGVGGIFYDYLGLNRLGDDQSPVTSGRFGKGGLNSDFTRIGMELAANAAIDWQGGFNFTQSVGRAFNEAYGTLVRKHLHESWTAEQRHHQLKKRGRYAEYNLLYDRGTRFGLMTGGNAEAILMSLPPVAIWE